VVFVVSSVKCSLSERQNVCLAFIKTCSSVAPHHNLFQVLSWHYSCAIARLMCVLEHCSYVPEPGVREHQGQEPQSCHCWTTIIAGNVCSMLEGAIAVGEVASLYVEESDLFSKEFMQSLLRSP
jgi:hypothetical protein